MTDDLNPSTPATVGVEWRPTRHGSDPVVVGPAPTAIIESHATETVEYVIPRLAVDLPRGTVNVPVVCDVYDASTGLTPWERGSLDHALFRTQGDAGVTAAGKFLRAGGSANLWQGVDETDHDLNTADYVTYEHSGQGTHAVRFRSGSAAVSADDASTAVAFAGRRIVEIRVVAWVRHEHETRTAKISGHVYIGGEEYAGQSEVIEPGGPFRRYEWIWGWNPKSGVPWSEADLRSLFTTGTNSYGLRARVGYAGGQLQIAAISMTAIVTDDHREATCYSDALFSKEADGAWAPLACRAVYDGTITPWSKQTGRTYWLVVYRPEVTGTVRWAHLAGGTRTGQAGQQTPLKADGSGLTEGGQIAWPPTTDDRAHAVLFRLQGGGISGDSQPYTLLEPVSVWSGQFVEQEYRMPDPVGGDYGLIRFAARRTPGGLTPTFGLDVSVYRRSDAALLATVTVAGDEIPDGTGDWQQVQARLPAALTLVAGVQYAVRWSSPTSEAASWQVAAIASATLTDTEGHPGTWQGTDAVLTVGTTDRADADVLGALATVPATLASLTVEALTYALPGGAGCQADTVGYAHIEWTASTLGGLFAYYEVERDDLDGWQTIARLTDESLPELADFEVSRNRQARWRARAVRADGAAGDWATTGYLTIVEAVDVLILTSNHDPTLTVAYPDETPREYARPSATDRKLVAAWGRPRYIALRPSDLEERGDTFTRRLTLAYNDPNADRGRVVFEPLDTLGDAWPNVTVLDSDGNRWWTDAAVTGYEHIEPARRHFATVEFVETSAVPAIVTASWTATDLTSGLLYGDPDGLYGDVGGSYGLA